jgi:peptidyl-prolyl cis-trans isomerase D
MFDFFRRHTRALQFLLVLLIFPSFVFFGIQGYSRFAGNDQQTRREGRRPAGHAGEFDNAMRERVDRARRQMPNLDAKMFETPEMRAMALDGVIRDRLTLVAADKLHLTMTDDRLDRAFKSDPEYAALRNPTAASTATR